MNYSAASGELVTTQYLECAMAMRHFDCRENMF